MRSWPDCSGHPRLDFDVPPEDVDARDKPGHDDVVMVLFVRVEKPQAWLATALPIAACAAASRAIGTR